MFSGTFLASNVTKAAVIPGWNDLDGSMGPGGHVRSLDLVMGDLPGVQWVQNDRLRGIFLASNVTKVAVISGWNGLDGSM